jgi:nitroimidazol reductase NimA-like FMN-containing flavoprotein (pyridoxamine 5'-phosphate oxidase superfamily)
MTDEFITTRSEMEAILREEQVGYLGLSAGDEPYVVPLNYGYDDGRVLFHCALEGKKLDWIRENPKVCFAVGRQSGEVRRHGGGDPCHVDSESVICYGRARIVEAVEERANVLNTFNRCYRPDADEIAPDRVASCYAVEVIIEEMTGRRELNRQRTMWRYRFDR